ncbi:MAG TPA: WYL domain-containing protein [Candidatus Omnitrophica bacterium]|nr:WYL domain-containing protein [Candidatus Omnitrophota bacterium]
MHMELSDLEYVIFDVETTGLAPEAGDRIVEIAAVKVAGNNIIGQFHCLVNSKVPISQGAFAVNGITDKMLKSALEPENVIPKFMDFIEDNMLFAYNAKFDIGFLGQELRLLKQSLPKELLVVDILAMARALLPNLGRYSLSFVAKHFAIKETQQHRALADAQMSLEVLKILFGILNKQGVNEFSYVKTAFCIDREVVNRAIGGRIAEIQEAMNVGARLKIRYFSVLRGEVTERDVTPREIMKEGKYDYLVGYCHLKQKERIFRIDGILKLEMM